MGYVDYKDINKSIEIKLFVSPTVDEANNVSQKIREYPQQLGIKLIVNKINIGNSSGELYSIVGSQDKQSQTQTIAGRSSIIFRKNNVIVSMVFSADVKVETLLNLAIKQEEKISRILDMIK